MSRMSFAMLSTLEVKLRAGSSETLVQLEVVLAGCEEQEWFD